MAVRNGRRYQWQAEEICNNQAPGGKPKSDIQIEKRPSNWPGMAVYVFTYTARVPGI